MAKSIIRKRSTSNHISIGAGTLIETVKIKLEPEKNWSNGRIGPLCYATASLLINLLHITIGHGKQVKDTLTLNQLSLVNN